MEKSYESPPLTKVELDQLFSAYSIRDGASIRQFLHINQEVLPLLRKAAAHAGRYFGNPPVLSLKLVTDPEDEAWEQLFVFVRTSLPLQEGFDQLERMSVAWWESLTPVEQEANESIVFDLEFA